MGKLSKIDKIFTISSYIKHFVWFYLKIIEHFEIECWHLCNNDNNNDNYDNNNNNNDNNNDDDDDDNKNNNNNDDDYNHNNDAKMTIMIRIKTAQTPCQSLYKDRRI